MRKSGDGDISPAVTLPPGRRPSQRAWSRAVAALLSAPVALGCVGAPKLLPPRTPPAAVPPPVSLPSTPILPERGRVVVWTTDGPMRVVAEAQAQFQAEAHPGPRAGELCVSPCVVDVPPGNYKLYLSGIGATAALGDVDELRVGQGLTYYLRAPGKFDPPRWLPGGATAVVVGGAIVTAIGLGIALSPNDKATVPGTVTVGVGLALLVGGGIYLYDAQRGSIQEGATTQWSVPSP
jgi:hypothetical protein